MSYARVARSGDMVGNLPAGWFLQGRERVKGIVRLAPSNLGAEVSRTGRVGFRDNDPRLRPK